MQREGQVDTTLMVVENGAIMSADTFFDSRDTSPMFMEGAQ